ncbi:MAG: Holliday junction branch migration protein RuvA [Bacilli bacterium]
MYEYINGLIKYIGNNKIVVEACGVGYLIYATSFFKDNEIDTVYVYHHQTELENIFYGFKSREDKEFFIELIKIKGLGRKLAIQIFKNDTNITKRAIANKDINYFLQFPKIGLKVASLIVNNYKCPLDTNNELIETLLSLGYKKNDIYSVITKINIDSPLENQIKESLSLL